MSNHKSYLLGFLILIFLMGFLLNLWDGSHFLKMEIEWVLKQLPDVKSIEYLEALKKS
jgi:hypothetical protein